MAKLLSCAVLAAVIFSATGKALNSQLDGKPHSVPYNIITPCIPARLPDFASHKQSKTGVPRTFWPETEHSEILNAHGQSNVDFKVK